MWIGIEKSTGKHELRMAGTWDRRGFALLLRSNQTMKRVRYVKTGEVL